jgi:putative oxidoreductase
VFPKTNPERLEARFTISSALRKERTHVFISIRPSTPWRTNMSAALGAAQGLLAVFFLAVGATHALRTLEKLKQETTWVGVMHPVSVRLIGWLEFAGALGLILPALTGVMPWLVLWAALGLTLTMLGAAVFHASRREYHAMPITLIPLALAAFVTVGRWA